MSQAHRQLILVLLAILTLLPPLQAAVDNKLSVYPGCEYVADEWNDGDSFVVHLPADEEGGEREMIVRLYGVDCIETSASDTTLARRLRSQVRYFGLEDAAVALRWGEAATEFTSELLANPFSVETFYSDGQGRGSRQRFYAYITLADGRDLGTVLVEQGYARDGGIIRGRPNGPDHTEYAEILADSEDSAKLGHSGIWSGSDGLRLQAGRAQERADSRELGEVQNAANPRPEFPLKLNQATVRELQFIKGVGQVTAANIIANRPYTQVDDLLQVEGIGPATLDRIRDFVVVEGE